MRLLLTGSTGFLGMFLRNELNDKVEVTEIGRKNVEIICDLSTQVPRLPLFDIVIHTAGKAHSIPKTIQQKQEFYHVNLSVTQNLLKGLELSNTRPQYFVFISTVAVYGLEKGEDINETYPLNAKEPYGLSKIKAEQLVQLWCNRNNVRCTILRLPLLVGENPVGNLGAMIQGIRKGYYFNVNGGLARRSMVMADDVAKIILKASKIGGIYHLTDGYHPSFKELSTLVAKDLGKSNPLNIPYWLAKIIAKIGDLSGNSTLFNTYKLDKTTFNLTFDDSKAREILGWSPQSILKTFHIHKELKNS